jgi:crotonobetainyl-CoA:carnitine CoA-transferase CaiB-like acyl-CoA transferase
MAITGEPDGEPVKLGVAIVDYCAGLMATISILAAIGSRDQTGRGQTTEVSLHDTGLQMLAAIASNHLISGDEAVRYGNGHPNLVPYRIFRAADGSFALGIGNDHLFQNMCEIMDRPEWSDDPRFARMGSGSRRPGRRSLRAGSGHQCCSDPSDHTLVRS